MAYWFYPGVSHDPNAGEPHKRRSNTRRRWPLRHRLLTTMAGFLLYMQHRRNTDAPARVERAAAGRPLPDEPLPDGRPAPPLSKHADDAYPVLTGLEDARRVMREEQGPWRPPPSPAVLPPAFCPHTHYTWHGEQERGAQEQLHPSKAAASPPPARRRPVGMGCHSRPPASPAVLPPASCPHTHHTWHGEQGRGAQGQPPPGRAAAPRQGQVVWGVLCRCFKVCLNIKLKKTFAQKCLPVVYAPLVSEEGEE